MDSCFFTVPGRLPADSFTSADALANVQFVHLLDFHELDCKGVCSIQRETASLVLREHMNYHRNIALFHAISYTLSLFDVHVKLILPVGIAEV